MSIARPGSRRHSDSGAPRRRRRPIRLSRLSAWLRLWLGRQRRGWAHPHHCLDSRASWAFLMADKFSANGQAFLTRIRADLRFVEVFTPLLRVRARCRGPSRVLQCKGGPSLGFIPLPPPGGTKSVWSASDAAANGMTLSNGGLTVTSTIAGYKTIRTSTSKTTGKWYVEVAADVTVTVGGEYFGFASSGFNIGSYLGGSIYSEGTKFLAVNMVSAGFVSNQLPAGTIGPSVVVGFAIDFAAGAIWTCINNVWTGNPATGSAPNVSFSRQQLSGRYF